MSRAATTFTSSGELDEDAFRQLLERLVDSEIGVILGSSGSGEGAALTNDELARVYRLGVEVGLGKVPVYSNQPEKHTAKLSIEQARIAIDAGVEAVNIYGPHGIHGYRATAQEYLTYFDRVFAVIGHPTTLCPQPLMGYTPPPAITARIANEYPQVVGILLSGITDDYYLVELMRELRRDVPVYVSPPGSMNLLSLGAAGLESPLANLMPLTCRAYLDRFDAGDLEGASSAYADITRVMEYTNHWKGATPRWIKAALKVFKLPGGDGGLREPYLMHSDAELERFATGIIALDVAEINDLARAAGRL